MKNKDIYLTGTTIVLAVLVRRTVSDARRVDGCRSGPTFPHDLSGPLRLRSGDLQAGHHDSNTQTPQSIDSVHRTRRPPTPDATAHPKTGGR